MIMQYICFRSTFVVYYVFDSSYCCVFYSFVSDLSLMIRFTKDKYMLRNGWPLKNCTSFSKFSLTTMLCSGGEGGFLLQIGKFVNKMSTILFRK